MSILERDMILENKEKALDWNQTFCFCKERWESEKDNIQYFLRLMTQSFFLLAYWDQIEHAVDGKKISGLQYLEKMDINAYHITLLECMRYGNRQFKSCSNYNCVSGLLMYIMPEWFYPLYPLDQCSQIGLNRICDADTCDEGMLFKNIVTKYIEADSSVLKQLFPGHSEIDMFFRSMLSYI